MLNRWDTLHNDLNVALYEVKRLSQKLIRRKEGRGRNPKHNPTKYAQLIFMKEFSDGISLRKAEVRLSEFVVGERVDHSVIAYWENKAEMERCLKIIVIRAGKLLSKLLHDSFSFVDWTSFSSWHIEEIQFHVCNRVAKETVYPVGISFLKKTIREPVDEVVPPGSGKLYADAGYDDDKTLRVLFRKGYEPIVCPNKGRWKGRFRKKARKLYRMRENRLGYRQRGRGESMFGSLTNEFGDRLHARKEQAMRARIIGRVVSYQVKLLIRAKGDKSVVVVVIFRHAPTKFN